MVSSEYYYTIILLSLKLSFYYNFDGNSNFLNPIKRSWKKLKARFAYIKQFAIILKLEVNLSFRVIIITWIFISKVKSF